MREGRAGSDPADKFEAGRGSAGQGARAEGGSFIDRLKSSKEFRNYIIWGVISVIVNIVLFQILVTAGLRYRVANIITLIFIRFFCYTTNKLFVFKTRCGSVGALLKEMLYFFLARMVTFAMDYFGVIFLVEVIGLHPLVSKAGLSVVVIISNYLFSKLFVFTKGKASEE